MELPIVKIGDWIQVKSNPDSFGIDGYVFSVVSKECLSVGYHQNGIKAIRENVIWGGEYWMFENSGPSGSYLKGPDEAIVKRGPPKNL